MTTYLVVYPSSSFLIALEEEDAATLAEDNPDLIVAAYTPTP